MYTIDCFSNRSQAQLQSLARSTVQIINIVLVLNTSVFMKIWTPKNDHEEWDRHRL